MSNEIHFIKSEELSHELSFRSFFPFSFLMAIKMKCVDEFQNVYNFINVLVL